MKTRRILAFLLCLCTLFSTLTVFTFSAQAATTYTYAQIMDCGRRIADWGEKYKTLLNTCVAGNNSTHLTSEQFMYLGSQLVINLSNGQKSGSLSVSSISKAPTPSGWSVKAYNMYKSEYVQRCRNVVNFINSNKAAPNYVTCNTGKLAYKDAVFALAKVVRYYYVHSALPDYVYTETRTWGSTYPGGTGTGSGSGSSSGSSSSSSSWLANTSGYSAYLVNTSKAPTNNATLQSVAKTGIAYGGNPSNMYQASAHLMNYLNAKTSYSNYYNTQKGALKTWTSKCGNCCDLAHLAAACARSVGIPVRYKHGFCKFTSGLRCGHVWVEYWCGSSGWKTVDLVSGSNYLGYKTNTTLYWMSGNNGATINF